MARNDEFNHVEVTNEKQIRGFEFGGTQNTEFSFQNVKRSGINPQPDDELNEGIQEVKESRKTKNVLQEEKELIEQATESSNASAPTTAPVSGSGATASTSGAAASSSAAAASGAASAAASTAAAAGTVVVAAFAVVTAAPVIMSKASAEIRYLEASENEIFYELELKDTLEDEKYYVILSNQTYEETQEIEFEEDQEFVTGYFSDLEFEQEYTFEVVEGNNESEITRKLVSKSLKTAAKAKVSEFRALRFNKEADYYSKTFPIQLDFIDENNYFSDFKFTLSNEEISHTYILEKTTNVQNLSLQIPEEDIIFYPFSSFNYEFSYLDKGEIKTFSSDEPFTFKDISGLESVFNSATLSNEADFIERELTITLDYDDPLEIFDYFLLHLSYIDDNDEIQEDSYSLLLVSGTQNVTLPEGISLEDKVFKYYVSYYEADVYKSTDEQEIRFVDKYNRSSTFTSAILSNEADFTNNQMFVTLTYNDDFNKFDQNKPVELLLVSPKGDMAWTYQLSWTNDKQTIDVDNFVKESGDGTSQRSPIISDNSEFSYTIGYYYKNEEELTKVNPEPITIIFTDPSVFTFKEIKFLSANFETSEITIQLDYEGPSEDVMELELELIDPSDSGTSCNLHPQVNKEEQTLEVTEMLDLEHVAFNYELRQYLDSDYNYKTLASGSNLTFTDSQDRKSELKGISFTESSSGKIGLNSVTGEFEMTLDYVDYFAYYNSFNLLIEGSILPTGGTLSYTFEDIVTTNEKQTLAFPKGTIEDFINDDSLTYSLTYLTRDSDIRQVAFTGSIDFEDTATDQILDFEHGDLVYQDNNYYLPYKFKMGDKTESEHLMVKIIDSRGGSTYVLPHNDDNDRYSYLNDYYQLGYFSTDSIDALIRGNVTFQVIYSDESDHVIYEEEGTLSLDDGTGQFTPLGIKLAPYFISDGYVVSLIYNGKFDSNSNIHLKFIFNSDEQTYEDCYLEEPSGYSYPLGPTINSSELQERLSNGESFDLYLCYDDGNGTVEVLCYKNFSFQV